MWQAKLFQDPQLFINKWLQSQTRDIKTMTDVTGNPEEERRVDYYYQPWVTEGVCRCSWQKLFWKILCLGFQVLLWKNSAKASGIGFKPGGAQFIGTGKQLNVKVSTFSSLDLVGLTAFCVYSKRRSCSFSHRHNNYCFLVEFMYYCNKTIRKLYILIWPGIFAF